MIKNSKIHYHSFAHHLQPLNTHLLGIKGRICFQTDKGDNDRVEGIMKIWLGTACPGLHLLYNCLPRPLFILNQTS